jgi:hypothetical protein
MMICASVKLYHPPYRNQWIDESPINVWLLANVGQHAKLGEGVTQLYPWKVEHHRDYLVYHFAREQDATMFALKFA